MLYSTNPLASTGARAMSVMSAFFGSFGSSVPLAVPRILSYVPTAPNVMPPNVGIWLGAVIAVVELMLSVTMPVAGGGGGGGAAGGGVGTVEVLLPEQPVTAATN